MLDRTDNWYSVFPTRKITVNAITGKDLLDKINKPIEICKLDVEGATYEVLQSFGDSIHKIKSFHLETEQHQFWVNQKTHNDVCEFMRLNGYHLLWTANKHPQTDSVWVLPEYLR